MLAPIYLRMIADKLVDLCEFVSNVYAVINWKIVRKDLTKKICQDTSVQVYVLEHILLNNM
jgi:predicted ATP-dependent Lon-type protease